MRTAGLHRGSLMLLWSVMPADEATPSPIVHCKRKRKPLTKKFKSSSADLEEPIHRHAWLNVAHRSCISLADLQAFLRFFLMSMSFPFTMSSLSCQPPNEAHEPAVCEAQVGEMSELGKVHGYDVTMAPAQSYLDTFLSIYPEIAKLRVWKPETPGFQKIATPLDTPNPPPDP